MLQECLARVSNFSEVLCDNELSAIAYKWSTCNGKTLSFNQLTSYLYNNMRCIVRSIDIVCIVHIIYPNVLFYCHLSPFELDYQFVIFYDTFTHHIFTPDAMSDAHWQYYIGRNPNII